MIDPFQDYDQAYADFRWNVPLHLNMATQVCDLWCAMFVCTYLSQCSCGRQLARANTLPDHGTTTVDDHGGDNVVGDFGG